MVKSRFGLHLLLRLGEIIMATILIVEDNKHMRDMLVQLMEFRQHNVVSAENGKQALEYLEAKSFDLLITDIVMPEKDGLSTILDFKRKNSGIKTIAISGGDRLFAGNQYLQIAQNIGADRVLLKPFDVKHLLSAIDTLLAPS